MTRIDLTCWPLVLSFSEGAQGLDDQSRFLAEWDHWLGRGQSFAVLRVFASEAALIHPEGGARSAKAWMRENGARIRHLVLGLASVVPGTAHERMSRMNLEQLFGVPAAVFCETEAALLWLEDRVFGPQGLTFPYAATWPALQRIAAARS
jgi:hypothetical protein